MGPWARLAGGLESQIIQLGFAVRFALIVQGVTTNMVSECTWSAQQQAAAQAGT